MKRDPGEHFSRDDVQAIAIEEKGVTTMNSGNTENLLLMIWRTWTRRLFIAILMVGGFAVTTFGEQDPLPPRPQVGTLQVTKFTGTNSARLSWSDGTAPFAVARSETPNFRTSTTGTFVSRTAASPTDDVGALNDLGKNYYYQIPDANSDPFVLGVEKLGGGTVVAGDTVSIDGWGFSGSPIVYFAGEEATPSVVTPTQLTVSFPLGGATGDVQVATSFVSYPRQSARPINQSFNDPWHLANDSLRNLYVADRTGGALWKMDGSTLAWSNLISLANCVGLPVDGSNNVYAVVGTTDPANVGVIKQISSSGSINTNWGTAMLSGHFCYPRALATPRLADGSLDPAPSSILMEDAANSCIRPITPGSTGGSCFFSTGALGGFPAGLAWLRTGNLLYTRGNTIFEITAAGVPVTSYHILSGVTLSGPGQLAVDKYGDVYGVDRLGNFAFKLRTTSGDQKMRILFQAVNELFPTAPRGVALDENTGDVWRSYIHISDGTAVYRFRRKDRVHVKIRVLDTALAGATLPTGALPPESFPQIDAEIRDALVMASGIFTQAGLEFTVDDSQLISDPTLLRDGGVQRGTAPTLSDDESRILGTRSTSENVVYLYVVHHFADDTRNLFKLAGRTYTSDSVSVVDLTGSGIIVARYWGPTGGDPTSALQGGYRGEPVPHELGHFMLSGFNNEGTGTEHTPKMPQFVGRLMYPEIGGFTGVTTVPERANIWTNSGFTAWIDHF